MSKKVLTNLDFCGNEIQNMVIQVLAAPPENPTIGRTYYDSTDHKLKTYNGTSWDSFPLPIPGSEILKGDGNGGVEPAISVIRYATIFDTEEVTTSVHDKTYPWAALSFQTTKLDLNHVYRVTFDGVPYIIRPSRWISSVNNNKDINFIGQAELWGDVDGYTGDSYDVPFLITNGMDASNAYTYGNYLFTETAGTHTVKLERVDYSYSKLPPELIYGCTQEVVKVLTGGVNTDNYGYSFGHNIAKTKVAVLAVGHDNIVDASGAIAIGVKNEATAAGATAIGAANKASGAGSHADGYMSEARGSFSKSSGARTIATHRFQYVTGVYNALDPSDAEATENGTYLEIVGNGTSESSRSNARTLDFEGNECLAGGITLGKGTANEVTLTPANLLELIAFLTSGVGLTDLASSIQSLINGAVQSTEKGAANGVASLDSTGKVPSAQLPSYVDDVVEGYYYNSKFYAEVAHTTELTGETGKIYVDLSTEKAYRWGGSAYVEISSSLALGETSSTAYRGDRGKAAYDHSQLTSGNPHNVGKSDVGLGNVDNTSDATKKANFKGSIASGNTGFVTGGDVYTAIRYHTSVVADSATISAGSTSVNIQHQAIFVNAYAKDPSGNQVIVNIQHTGDREVTFSIAAAVSFDITCVVVSAY